MGRIGKLAIQLSLRPLAAPTRIISKYTYHINTTKSLGPLKSSTAVFRGLWLGKDSFICNEVVNGSLGLHLTYQIYYFLGFSRVIKVTSKYLLAAITICLERLFRETWYFVKKPYNKLVLQTIQYINWMLFLGNMTWVAHEQYSIRSGGNQRM